jgi:hypothetical protein
MTTFDPTQRNFDHASLDLHLVLRRAADDLTQNDVDKFMAAFAGQTQGNTPPEDNGKTLRAALAAGWVESFTAKGEAIVKPDQVDGMKPAHVRWAALQIDRVYNKAREVPNE